MFSFIPPFIIDFLFPFFLNFHNNRNQKSFETCVRLELCQLSERDGVIRLPLLTPVTRRIIWGLDGGGRSVACHVTFLG